MYKGYLLADSLFLCDATIFSPSRATQLPFRATQPYFRATQVENTPMARRLFCCNHINF